MGSTAAFAICGDSSRLFSWGFNLNHLLGISKYPDLYQSVIPLKPQDMTNVKFCTSDRFTVAIKNDQTG